MAISIVRPSSPPVLNPYTRARQQICVTPPDTSKALPSSFALKVPYFIYDGVSYVLIRDLASLWNYPSSYQVIAKLTKKSGISRHDLILTSDEGLNDLLIDQNLLSPTDRQTRLFYVNLLRLYQILQSHAAIMADPHAMDSSQNLPTPAPPADDDPITISQVFPNYGCVEQTLPLTHASFLTLTPLTKLHLCKHEGNYRKVFGTSLSAYEREILLAANNYAQYDASKFYASGEQVPTPPSRKPLGRHKKYVGNIDPNQLDVAENVFPGSGFIPEFNVSSICKVPNYYVTNNQMNAAQQNALFNPTTPHLESLQICYKQSKTQPAPLLHGSAGSDQDASNFKYFYYKTYRGPGSGNYKDAATVNRINKVRWFPPSLAPKSNDTTHVPAGKVIKSPRKKRDKSIKGLVHEYFNHENVEIVIERQRQFTEDFENVEMLHNNTLFNLLINGYRDVAKDTWRAFFKFKMIDFEKLSSFEKNKAVREKIAKIMTEQRENSNAPIKVSPELADLSKADLTRRFALPSDHKEIMEKLPVELRGDPDDPVTSISQPVRYVATYPDRNTPEVLNQIEVVKLPNGNSLAWDNIKKYRRR